MRRWQSSGHDAGTRVLLVPGDRLEFLVSALAGAIGGYQVVSVSQRATAAEVAHIRGVARADFEWELGASHDFEREPAPPPPPAFHNVRVIFFTSGTTSLPKGVCHDFETLLANADAFNDSAGLDRSVRLLHVMPTGYMAGLLNTFLSPLMAGGVVVLGDAFDAPSALGFWAAAKRHDVNTLWLSPTMAATLAPLARGAELPAWAAAHLRHVFVGTAPLHTATRDSFRARVGVDCLESYGMTECMFVSVNHPDVPNPGHSVGRLLRGVEGQVRGASGEVLPSGAEGELWLRSAYSGAGYLDDATGEPVHSVTADGWLDTGDVARFDDAGLMTITGRRKDLIIRGGTNVSPKAVEEVALSFPGVRDAAVVGIPHPYWGEEVVACLVAEPGQTIDTLALLAHCAARLNPDAVPSRCLVFDEFPRSSAGKVQKHLLRAAAEQPGGQP